MGRAVYVFLCWRERQTGAKRAEKEVEGKKKNVFCFAQLKEGKKKKREQKPPFSAQGDPHTHTHTEIGVQTTIQILLCVDVYGGGRKKQTDAHTLTKRATDTGCPCLLRVDPRQNLR